MLEEAAKAPSIVAQYIEPASFVQMVCNHPAPSIALQKEITDLKS
jgi:hypothetical protein